MAVQRQKAAQPAHQPACPACASAICGLLVDTQGSKLLLAGRGDITCWLPTALMQCRYKAAAWCLQGGKAVSCEHSACPPAQPMDRFPHNLGDVKPLGPQHYSKRWKRERMTQVHRAVFGALQVSCSCRSRAGWRISSTAPAVLQDRWQDGTGGARRRLSVSQLQMLGASADPHHLAAICCARLPCRWTIA